MMNQPMMNDNPFARFLEGNQEGARANYFSRIPQNFAYGQQNFLQDLFQPTFNRYLGELGRQVTGGGAPTLSFTDFLNTNFNPQQDILHAPATAFDRRLTGAATPLVRPARYFFGG